MHFREKTPALAEPMRLQIELPDRVYLVPPGNLALSPDGRNLAFFAMGSDGVTRLWVRPLNSLEARPLFGTETNYPAAIIWSPDSCFIAFATGDKLKKIDVSGGLAQTICDLSGYAVGGSWSRDGVIIFGSSNGGLMRVSATGGAVSPLTKLNSARQETWHDSPVFLPDGQHFLYCRSSGLPNYTGVYVGSLNSQPEEQGSNQLIATNFGPIYLPSQNSGPGQLLFLREQTLMAQPFDDKHLALTGEPLPVAEPVGNQFRNGLFSASTNGVLVYRQSMDNRITWFDRSGRKLGMVGQPGLYPTFDLSKDARLLVVSKTQSDGHQNLWVIDLARESTTRLTVEPADHDDPRWSPDGRQVIFGSTIDPTRSPFQVSLPGSKPAQVFKFEGKQFALDDWSPDGRHLLYHDSNQPELWALPLGGDRKPMLIVRSLSGYVDQARFSPDGRWIAYNTDESGRMEVKVVRFPPTSDKWQISTAGGVQPTWRGDGRELYFLEPDATLMSVDVQPGSIFEWGTARPLFKTPLNVIAMMEQYAPAPDGKRFLIVAPDPDSLSAPFTVFLNWTALLKK